MTHLKEWQRYQIAAKLEAGCSKKEIAEYLHVHPSTITREIQRNGYSRYRCYKPRIAQERAAHRWRCRHLPRRFKEDVRKKVDEMILMEKGHNPQQD
ncbi:MAG: helix-turn-helix domain-containing protein [Bacteroidaceae bacterium]|nr:helix-turn-helix domain-containing protein [Bacteroidaceae bacterium]